MSHLLPMMTLHSIRVGIAVLLNVGDLVVAFFLVLGGWNATASHPVTGYVAMVFGPILVYLSVGLWTNGTWRPITRIVLYGGALLALGVSAAVLIGARAVPSEERFVFYLGVSILFLSVLLSIVHFRFLGKERLCDPIQPTS